MRKVRDKLGLSQGELAELLGVHWVTVSRWESGRMEPRAEHLQGVARLYITGAFAQVRELVRCDGAPFSEPAPHVLAYDLPEVQPACRRYTVASLKTGYYLCLVTSSPDTEEEILRRWGLPNAAPQREKFEIIQTKDAFFRDGHYDLSQMNYLGRKREEELRQRGWQRVRWVDDISGLLSLGVSWDQLVAMEYNANSVFQSQKMSEGLSIYPYPTRLEHPGQVCILCRHPQLLASGGIVENPYYDDVLLCWARAQLTHGESS